MSARRRTSARVLEKRKRHHAETEHRAARRAPAFRDCFVLAGGRYWLCGWVHGKRRGFLLRPQAETDASDADVCVSFDAWRDELIYDLAAGEWHERPRPRGAA